MKNIVPKTVTESESQYELIPKFIAFGNALLDYSIIVKNDLIHQRNQLDLNEEGECSSGKIANILSDMKNEKDSIIKCNTGGSALNTCRTLRAIGEKNLIFYGSIGSDENGILLQKQLEQNGVRKHLFIDTKNATGIAVCLILNENRCAFANIGAAQYIPEKSILLSSLNSYLNNTQPTHHQIIYIEGFFLTASRCWRICQDIYDEILLPENNSNRITFAMNLSSKYIITENSKEIQWLAERSDLIFGNAGEFKKFANTVYQVEFMDALMDILVKSSPKNSRQRKKIFVITNGSLCVDVYCKNEYDERINKASFMVPEIQGDKLVDTTGAGDAFVAGFCYEYLRNSSIDDCVKCGIEVAVRKISIIGGSLPLNFNEDDTE